MSKKNDYLENLSIIANSFGSFNSYNDGDKIEDCAYADSFTTEQQKIRDEQITKLLTTYVKTYEDKSKSNNLLKSVLFWLCFGILIVLTLTFFIVLVFKFDLKASEATLANVVQVISICVTFSASVIGLLRIITRYVFPENEEQYITRIVEIIQKNDLENKKENIKVVNK